MKKYTILLVGVMLVLCSCSKPTKLLLYNNTGLVIHVEDGAKRVAIAASCSKKIKYPTNGRLSIECGNASWTYTISRYPPMEYCEPTAATIIYAQIETNGAIYVFLPKSNLPSPDLDSQPEGFPLMPLP